MRRTSRRMHPSGRLQALRVRTKFWPVALVQLSWLVEIIRQLKLIGD
jgi:hypothetical protein